VWKEKRQRGCNARGEQAQFLRGFGGIGRGRKASWCIRGKRLGRFTTRLKRKRGGSRGTKDVILGAKTLAQILKKRKRNEKEAGEKTGKTIEYSICHRNHQRGKVIETRSNSRQKGKTTRVLKALA